MVAATATPFALAPELPFPLDWTIAMHWLLWEPGSGRTESELVVGSDTLRLALPDLPLPVGVPIGSFQASNVA